MQPEDFSRLSPGRLLVVLPNWLGDVIQVTPALRALRRHFPEARMTLLGRPAAEGLVRGAAWCDDFRVEIPGGQDAAVVLPMSFRAAWRVWRAGVPNRAGFDGEFRRWLLTFAVPRLRWDRRRRPYSRIVYLRRLLRGLGIELGDESLELPLDPGCEERVEGLMREKGLDPARPLVAVNPGAAFGPSKCWPAEHFARAADLAAEEFGAQVYILAGPGEEPEGERIRSAMRSRAVVFGPDEADLRMIKSLVKRSMLMISNDSGPRHIAACYDVPCVVLVGPFHPVLSHNGHARTAMLWEGVECSPCHLRSCPIDHRCMRRITPERVLEEASRLVAGR